VVTVTVTDGAQSVQRAFTVQLAPTLAYRIIALPGPVGSQVTRPVVIGDDGRIGGFGDSQAGGVSRAFVNRGFLNGFSLQPNLIDQETGRVNGLATVDGLEVSVGEYRINGEWRAFLHTGGSLINLGKPSGSSASRATAVNSARQVVGYYTVNSSEKAFLSTGNPDAFTDISPAGSTTSRAVGVNDGGSILIRSGSSNDFKAWIRGPDGITVDLEAPDGHRSPNPLSIANNGLVLAEVTHQASGSRRLASYLTGERWTVLADSTNRWAQFEGGRMNGFRFAVGSARTNPPTGRSLAVLRAVGQWYALNDLVPTNSGWNLETATSVNEDGFIVGTGSRNGVQSAYLAIPANIIGQRVARPEGAAARYPDIRIVESSVGDDEVNSFLWSELEKSLYAIRPVTARIDSAAPPRPSPSIRVSTTPVMPTLPSNSVATFTASCPVRPSTTSSVSRGEVASRTACTSSISTSSMCSRPAVSSM
jgi:hypothetical protein